jgi:hypothetical protein
LRNFYVANFVYGKSDWVGELLQDGNENYLKWQKIIQSLTYTFENDIVHLLDEVEKPNDLLLVKSNEFPKLLQSVMNYSISIETVIILNDIMNFFPMWKKQIDDDIVWPDWQRRIEKYSPFIHYDKTKLKNILKEKIKEYA